MMAKIITSLMAAVVIGGVVISIFMGSFDPMKIAIVANLALFPFGFGAAICAWGE
jgi:hypothetical protein